MGPQKLKSKVALNFMPTKQNGFKKLRRDSILIKRKLENPFYLFFSSSL